MLRLLPMMTNRWWSQNSRFSVSVISFGQPLKLQIIIFYLFPFCLEWDVRPFRCHSYAMVNHLRFSSSITLLSQWAVPRLPGYGVAKGIRKRDRWPWWQKFEAISDPFNIELKHRTVHYQNNCLIQAFELRNFIWCLRIVDAYGFSPTIQFLSIIFLQ